MNRRQFLAGAAGLAVSSRMAGAQTAAIPRGYSPDNPAPLIVMLHGAGNTGRGVAYTFPLADEFGVVVLAPDSRDEATWDMLLTGYGPDVEFIGAALKRIRTLCNIDGKRTALAGHSDGA